MEEFHHKEIELAWCAGFFDGEGNTTIDKYHRQQTYPPTTIRLIMQLSQCIDKHVPTNNAPLTLVRFLKALNIGSIYLLGVPKTNRRRMYKWTCKNKDCLLVFKLLKPYLSLEKITQFMNCLKQTNFKLERV